MRRPTTFLAAAVCATAAIALAPSAALAEKLPGAEPTVVTRAVPAPRLATVFELKLRLPEGRGLARLLLDAGVASDDAAEAARLAAGHLGDGSGGSSAKVEISRPLDATGLRLERLILSSADGTTIIERRGDTLALTSTAAHAKAAALI
jgi:hypothetical protein